MARGLENLLAKIDENPRQTLVSRYLALIADIKDEVERAEFALALAERLVINNTNEALRIAHMVYETGRHQTRALRVVIACFEQKGRAGKVAVLKLELEKLEQELSAGSVDGASRASLQLPGFRIEDLDDSDMAPRHLAPGVVGSSPLPPDAFRQARSEDTRVADLDLSGNEGMFDGEASHAVDLLFQDERALEATPQKAEEVSLDLAEGVLARLRGRPGDTVLPPGSSFPGGERRSGTIVSQIDLGPPSAQPQRTVKLDEMPRVTLDESRQEQGLPQESVVPPPANALSGARGTAPSEIFDRFFAAGKFVEAEVVLESSRSEEHHEWWQLRRLKLDFARQQFIAPKAVSQDQVVVNSQAATNDLPQPFSGDFRKGIMTEMLSLAEREWIHPSINSERSEGPSVPLRLLSALRSLPHETPADEVQLFEVLQGLFPGGGNDQVLHLLHEKSLTRKSPAWFGFYLDSLMSCGYARKVVAESVLMTLKWSTDRPLPLEWVRVIWQRLPRAWHELGSSGFSWSEEDGTRMFVQLMNKRPRLQVKHFL